VSDRQDEQRPAPDGDSAAAWSAAPARRTDDQRWPAGLDSWPTTGQHGEQADGDGAGGDQRPPWGVGPDTGPAGAPAVSSGGQPSCGQRAGQAGPAGPPSSWCGAAVPASGWRRFVHKASGDVDMQVLRDHVVARCRAVIEIPYASHLVTGGLIDLDRVAGPTRRAYLELAAAVADGFALPPLQRKPVAQA
jgi:hypothetical protein